MSDYPCTDTYTDLRAVVMEKNIQRENISIPQPSDGWLVLGHMDSVHVKRISLSPKESLGAHLDRVQAHNQSFFTQLIEERKNSVHFQSLYILQEFSEKEYTRVEAFWNQPSAFLTITRIHSTGQDQASFESDIDRQLCLAGKENVRLPLSNQQSDSVESKNCLGEQVAYLRYKCLELSDVILISKSDSAEALLSLIGCLFVLETVGDIYSYYCISNSELSGQSELAVNSDCISLISTRFSVQKANEFHRQIATLETMFRNPNPNVPSSAFFVSGMEDINLVTYNKSSRQLCEIFQKLLSTKKDFNMVFEDSTTRLGIFEDKLLQDFISSKKSKSNGDQDLTNECEILRNSFFDLCKQHSLKKDWVRPLMELLNMLYYMSMNCILRQVCYVLLNGLQGLVYCIGEQAKQVEEQSYQSELQLKREREIMQIIAWVDQLMERIIQMEGELMHCPEARPMLFDIPVNLLEFYLLFSEQAIRYFQDREGENRRNRSYQLLLVPNLCQTISIFDYLNVDHQDSKQFLLFVELSSSLLYNPFSVICKLVHEMAHYGGEITRERELRFSCLNACSAFLLADRLGMGDSDSVIQKIFYKIGEIYPKNKRLYMRDIVDFLFFTVNKIACAELLVQEFEDIYLATYEGTPIQKAKWLDQHITAYYKDRRVNLTQNLEKMLWEIEYLFKETYADLAMLTLLDLRAEDYIKALEESEFPKNVVSEVTIACRIERAALVLYTIDEENLLGLSSCQDLDLAKKVRQYCKVFSDPEGKSEDLPTQSGKCGYHNFEIMDSILRYLRGCYQTIQRFDAVEENQKELRQIRENFRLFAREQRFASSEFFKIMENYRPKLIHRNKAQD